MLVDVPGCGSTAPIGGLNSDNFRMISRNGFDPADHRRDFNDYAWSMTYFTPDGSEVGHVYCGTGNDMIGLVYESIEVLEGLQSIEDIHARPPELRRYRPDLGPKAWERVLDYRDIEDGPEYATHGFRSLAVYRSATDGKARLYAGTMSDDATVWRSESGEPGSWEQVWSLGEVNSVRSFATHNGLLYFALAADVPVDEPIARVWATDGDAFWPVVSDGFGNPDNTGAMALASFNDWLYVGTRNEVTGYEVWKLLGPDGADEPVQIVSAGGPSPINQAAATFCIFRDRLYVGNLIDPVTNLTGGPKAADIIRIAPDDSWKTIVGPGSITGIPSGFDHWPNAYIWSMTVHDGLLYAATMDQISGLFNMIEQADRMIAIIKASRDQRRPRPLERIYRAGADLYKTADGITWYPVTVTGFRDVGNQGFRNLVSVGDELYVGTTNPFDGLEVWRGRPGN
jgi:hypothetical protein